MTAELKSTNASEGGITLGANSVFAMRNSAKPIHIPIIGVGTVTPLMPVPRQPYLAAVRRQPSGRCR